MTRDISDLGTQLVAWVGSEAASYPISIQFDRLSPGGNDLIGMRTPGLTKQVRI